MIIKEEIKLSVGENQQSSYLWKVFVLNEIKYFYLCNSFSAAQGEVGEWLKPTVC
ncbi:MAG: hypothetical protein U5K00_21495 [Melioribacteraceae bacterium]|nr:hypothetical protein [Melioribacteraceae bacterium]